jgi:hypothetical protein
MTTAKPFLEELVQTFRDNNKRDHADQLIVFPNRRAGLFFKRALSQTLDGPVWAPQVKSIQDFVSESAPVTIPGKISLLLELYQAYKGLGIEESFDHFYGWGEVLIRDFDEIDKYLVSGEQLFQEILDLKTIETAFEPDDQQAYALAQFWRNMNEAATDESGVGQAFLEIWRTNRAVYQAYRKQLWEKGWAYDGMAYRLLAEHPEKGHYGSWSHITFAGFNALSPSEVAIFQYWQAQGKASIFWDADPYYLDDDRQEAGTFLRHHFQQSFERPGEPWIAPHLAQSEKQIAEYGVPLNVGQAKALGQLLAKHQDSMIPEKTAVVLPDEDMLFPTLNALPEEITDINVTMGYPLRNTPFYSLFQNLIKMQREASGSSDEKQFYYQEVVRLLRHPYIYPVAPDAIYQEEQRLLSGNAIFIPASQLKAIASESEQTPIFDTLFDSVENVEEAFTYFKEVLLLLQDQLEEGVLPNTRVEQEFLYQFHVQLKQLTDALQTYDVGLSLDTFWRLFSQIIQQEQLPFNGEPLKGLQVMGLLETRNLDFDHLYILSANEGQIPPQSQQQTFIPFNVRRAFGLPTQDDQSAVFAYHFYRLIQRAESVTFLYDTEQNSLDKGEQSRFLPQLKLELTRQNPAISYTQQVLNPPIPQLPSKPITVEKNKGVWQALTAYLGSDGYPPEKSLSPSALLTYLTCPLQFYFKYIVGLKEQETVREEVAPDMMGNIFHSAAANLYGYYRQHFGDEVTSDKLEKLYPQIKPYVDQAFSEHFSEKMSHVQGGNQLVRDVLIRQLEAVVANDQSRSPFQLIGLESSNYRVSINFDHYDFPHYVYLKGIIDRLERDEQGVRVIDYKTGNAEKPHKDLSKPFSNPEKHRATLQLLWYTYLFHRSRDDEAESLFAAIYPVKTLNNAFLYLKGGDSPIDNDDWETFEENVTNALKNLFDPQEPFYQTSNTEICKNCPFNAICYRQYA